MSKVLLITGASRGIGAETARLAAERGYALCLNYLHSHKTVEKLTESLVGDGHHVITHKANVGVESEVMAMYQAIDREFGRLDGLVNNAGILEQQSDLVDMSRERWQRILDINVIGSFLCAREAVRRMSTRNGGQGGAIVNLSSRAADLGAAHEYIDYAASKGAIDAMTIGLAKEVGDQGIRVNAVKPGLIYTDIHADSGEAGRVDRLKTGVPMQRGGLPIEVAEAVVAVRRLELYLRQLHRRLRWTLNHMAIKHNPASIPLLSLNAIAFDSETTGLDTSVARMIQLGGVRIVHGEVDATHTFQAMINPGEPIPPASQAIHHISDADVADAAGFAEVVKDFDAWRQDSVLVGYASGFDLAMLKRERELAGLEWIAPRCLDVRFLVNLLGPNLPDFSLDTIAGWVGVEIKHRHSALGDAIATAEIFVALIPRLRERGIRTLAEVERACERFDEAATREAQIGWLDIQEASKSRATLERIDSFPYRHRLRDLMSSPPIMIDPDISLREALAQLIDNQVSSVYVHPVVEGDKPGIVTERDLLRKFHEVGKSAFALPVSEIAVYPLASLSGDAFVYRAIARMKRMHVRHIGVHDFHGRIVGALSARDLLRQRADDAILLGDHIDTAQTAGEMSAVWGKIALVAKSLVAEEVDARDIAAVISRELCALTRQACILAERSMETPPPCSYAMLVLGSGGRGESLLAMDQDNALIYAEGEPGGPEDLWFEELGKRVSTMLDEAGVPLCKGNIMASNPEWRRSVEGWHTVVKTWLMRNSPEDILNCDIFFDSVGVHGDRRLSKAVLKKAFKWARKSTPFIKLMSVNACKISSPLGMFGRFKLVNGRMDLKMGGIMPLFSTARILAIKNGDRVRSTPDRFASVSEDMERFQTTLLNLVEAHRILFNAILHQQLLDLEAGIPLSNRVDPGTLSASSRGRLKWALEQVPNVSNLLGVPIIGE